MEKKWKTNVWLSDYQLLLMNHELSAGPCWLCVCVCQYRGNSLSQKMAHGALMLCLFKASLPEIACHSLKNSKYSNSSKHNLVVFSFHMCTAPNYSKSRQDSDELVSPSHRSQWNRIFCGLKAQAAKHCNECAKFIRAPALIGRRQFFLASFIFILWIKVFGTAYHGTAYHGTTFLPWASHLVPILISATEQSSIFWIWTPMIGWSMGTGPCQGENRTHRRCQGVFVHTRKLEAIASIM